MPNQLTLFPLETKQYDMWLLRELMNNCIAHSNYALGGRINVDEEEDEITLRNPGSFLPGSIEVALQKNYTPPLYRNQLLAETMMKFNMIDTQSMGIRKVYKIQQEKYFPMPDYNLSVGNQVGVTVYGKVLDENYTKLLFEHSEFDIQTVFLIDQVQKHHTITNEQVKYLRKLQVIEGRMPNIYLSADIAKTLEKKEQYVINKGFDDEYYRNSGSADRRRIYVGWRGCSWCKGQGTVYDPKSEDWVCVSDLQSDQPYQCIEKCRASYVICRCRKKRTD